MPTNKMKHLGVQFPSPTHRPWFRYLEAEPGAETPPAEGESEGEPPFVPVNERTPEERAAYWHEESKKQQKVRDAYGKLGSVDDVKAKLAELEELKRGPRTDQQKADDDARTAAERNGAAKATLNLAPYAVTMAVVALTRAADEDIAAATERVSKQMQFIDISKFLNDDGEIDPEFVQTYADSLGSSAPQTPPPSDPLAQMMRQQRPPANGHAGTMNDAYQKAYEQVKKTRS